MIYKKNSDYFFADLFESLNFPFFKILLDSGADANRMYLLTRAAPIHVASRKGHRGILDLLIAYGANVNAVTSDGKTCLHILATKCVSSSGDKNFFECLTTVLNSKGVQVSIFLLLFRYKYVISILI